MERQGLPSYSILHRPENMNYNELVVQFYYYFVDVLIIVNMINIIINDLSHVLLLLWILCVWHGVSSVQVYGYLADQLHSQSCLHHLPDSAMARRRHDVNTLHCCIIQIHILDSSPWL